MRSLFGGWWGLSLLETCRDGLCDLWQIKQALSLGTFSSVQSNSLLSQWSGITFTELLAQSQAQSRHIWEWTLTPRLTGEGKGSFKKSCLTLHLKAEIVFSERTGNVTFLFSSRPPCLAEHSLLSPRRGGGQRNSLISWVPRSSRFGSGLPSHWPYTSCSGDMHRLAPIPGAYLRKASSAVLLSRTWKFVSLQLPCKKNAPSKHLDLAWIWQEVQMQLNISWRPFHTTCSAFMEGKGERAQAWESSRLGLSPDCSVGICRGSLSTSQGLGFPICEMERLATNLGLVLRVIEGNRGKACDRELGT